MNNYTPQTYFGDSTHTTTPHKVITETVKEILTITKHRLKKPWHQLVVLDVGCGWGEYAFELEKSVKSVIAIEPWDRLYNTAIVNKRKRKSKVQFYNCLIEDFDTKQMFDLAISLTTVEHMPDANASFRRILKLLKPGGILYLTAPNKLWPFEPHYRLLFLNWLPLPIANFYLQLTRKGQSFVDSSYARTYFGMKELFNKFDCTYEFLVPQDEHAAYLGCGTGNLFFRWFRVLGIRLIKRFPIFWLISKGFIMVITKNVEGKNEKKSR